MLNLIAGELQYLGIKRVVDVKSGKVTWASSLQLGAYKIFHGSGVSPDGALAVVLGKIASGQAQSGGDKSFGLDQIARNLLQLVLTASQLEPGHPAIWSAVGHFRRRRAFWFVGPLQGPTMIRVTCPSPDEALAEFVRQALGKG